MAFELLTKEDLHQFKTELIKEIKELISGANPNTPRKWLKSYEVRDLLGISPGTLQNMRINGTLPCTKVGGLLFYSYDDIHKLMESKKRIPRGARM